MWVAAPPRFADNAGMTRIGIIGSDGRMGRALGLAVPTVGAMLSGGVDAGGDVGALAKGSDVLVDFSVAGALAANLGAATAAGCAILVGTTGLEARHHELIDSAAGDIAVLQAANTSLGVNLLAALVERAARALGPEWDVEILEMHHRMKVDAPSGTALMLGDAAARGRGIAAGPANLDRNGRRDAGGIGYASLRGGSVAGDHQVILATDGERIELGHRAETREIFANGAVRAALWLAGRPAGRYAMVDVLGL